MKVIRVLLIIILLSCSLSLFAQGVYLEKGSNGFGGEARAIWSDDGFEATDVTAGYSIAGVLDIGAGLTYTTGELGGFSSSDLRIAIDYSVNVVKQSKGVPLSLQIMGSYGLNDVNSEFFDSLNTIRRGTGYTIGLDLSRNFRLVRFLHLHMNLLVDYESFTYTDRLDSDPTVITNEEHARNFFYGGGGGFLFVFPKGQTLAIRAEIRADEDRELQIHPVVGVAFPQK